MIGQKDAQSVHVDGRRSRPLAIDGVQVHEHANVLTRSGHMSEVFRADWPIARDAIAQINWVELAPGAVTDWHVHADQTDLLTAVGGVVKLALWDGRAGSPAYGASDIVRMGALRPTLVRVPPGVWHGLRNESGAPAGYLNFADRLYIHAEPDSWRAKPSGGQLPDIL